MEDEPVKELVLKDPDNPEMGFILVEPEDIGAIPVKMSMTDGVPVPEGNPELAT